VPAGGNIEVVHLFAIEYWGISSSSKAFDISSGFLIESI
jgi:hypothetical protein